MSSDPVHSRREFLQGRAAVDAVTAAVERVLPGESGTAQRAASTTAASADQERYLVQYSRQAMACTFAIFLNAGQYEHGADVALAALDLIETLEAQLTIYRDTSEVMRLNRAAGQQPVVVEQGLFALLDLAVQISRESHGAFDVTAGPLVKAWGFAKRAGAIPEPAALEVARAHVGFQHLRLDAERGSVAFDRPEMELNLGAIGKGYALDRVARLLRSEGITDFLLHGGQSSVLAGGGQGAVAAQGWVVGLRDPLRPERRLGEICLRGRALATSGASQQFFRHAGKRYGHILDPRSGWPADGVFSATALASTAAEADALSTAFYTMGVTAARDFCRSHADVGMILLYPSASGSSVEVAVAGIAAQDWRPLA